MTQNEAEERKARELFQQLKRNDELFAPDFFRVMNAALANGERPSSRWQRLRLVVIPMTATLLLLLSGWLWFVQRQELFLPPDPPELSKKGFCNCPTEPVIAKNDAPPKVVRYKRTTSPKPINTLVSQWRSPTEFLLKTPGERWMKEVPKLGVPRLDIKSLDFEQKNEMEEL
ncbi:MAG: hypothetical protein JNK38_06785 [Acidobacteria bacterium]|nr:hypothetical protein [Acidobacteriota bacterium]